MYRFCLKYILIETFYFSCTKRSRSPLFDIKKYKYEIKLEKKVVRKNKDDSKKFTNNWENTYCLCIL